MKKSCWRCKYINIPYDEYPCNTCDAITRHLWTPVENNIIRNTVIEKRCESCTYVESGYYSPYCMYCNLLIHSNWKPKEEEMKKEFTKADLKDGMVVRLRNGKPVLYLHGKLLYNACCDSITNYTDDLKYIGGDIKSDHDIMRVHGVINCINDMSNFKRDIIWERKETKELTLKEIAEKFGVDEVKIIDD